MNIPRPEYPRPQTVRKEWMNLNGVWEFEIDHGNSGKERKFYEREKLEGEILVPFCPESSLSGVGYKDFMAAVWYRRVFVLPAEWEGSRTLLHFGAVDYRCDVWINGIWTGSHSGGYVPFQFDITQLLKQGENTITVSAEDDTRSGRQPSGKQSMNFQSNGCVYTRTTGIWQTVWLESVPTEYISDWKIVTDIAAGRVFLDIETAGENTDGMSVTATAVFDGRKVGSTTGTIVWKNGKLAMDLSEKHLWAPGDPDLYSLRIELSAGDGKTGAGTMTDGIDCYFGLRAVAIEGDKLMFNGKVQYQRLVLDQGFYPDGIYTAPTDDAIRNDVEIALALGFNGVRLHQKIFEPRYLYWADRLGLLVWEEHANWGFDNTVAENIYSFLPEWLEAMKRDFNSPAIIGWCPFNETPVNQNADLMRMVYAATKMTDPTRPVIDTSGYVHVVTDVFDIHDYDQSPESWAEKLKGMQAGGSGEYYFRKSDKSTYTGQPYFVSEFGGIWWVEKDTGGWGYGKRPASVEEFMVRYDGLVTLLLDTPAICAFCYTQLYDIEQEVNGLYTYDRKPKFDIATIRKINVKEAAIEKKMVKQHKM